MIRTISDILKGFIDAEQKKLDQFELKHGPTIGKMYEGLAANVIERAIPEDLNLNIVSGVIYGDIGNMTGEIDCMLVRGEGIQIPYTTSFKWHIKDVIAVFEIKKNLYTSELQDAFIHLREVSKNHGRYLECGQSKETFDVSSAIRAFSEITSVVPPSRDKIEELDYHLEMIYHTLIIERISPVRIVLGYHGFRSEHSLRNGLIKFLKENISNSRGFGVGSFPQLIICNNYSLIKLNGQPYSAPLQEDEWIFYASSRSNPLLLILELIWTRLSILYDIGGLWGEDLDIEAFVPLLRGKVINNGKIAGWNYNYYEFNKKEIGEFESSYEWEPVYLNSKQFTVMNELCRQIKVNIKDTSLISFIEKNGENFDSFIKSMLNTNLVGLNGDELQLITRNCQCAILPNGKFAAAENNAGHLTRWMLKHIINKK